MIDKEIVEKMKPRYPHIHPLIFHRAAEKAKTAGELFDLLESFPNEYPLLIEEGGWSFTNDLYQSRKFKIEKG
jgi:hypothetical protein